MERRIFQYYEQIERKLAEKYESTGVDGRKWFKISDEHYVHLDRLIRETEYDDALVLEHADGLEKVYIAPDGDSFHPSDMTVDEMFLAMLREIEESNPEQ